MRKLSGRLGLVLSLASVLAGACGTSTDGAPPGAAGTAGAAGTGAGAAAHGGDASASGGSAGDVNAMEGGASDGGAQSGNSSNAGDSSGAGDSGGAGDLAEGQTAFIDQIVLSQGGGPPRCLPRALPTGLPGSAHDGRASCIMAELKSGSCDCSQTARAALPDSFLTATKKQLQAAQVCDGTTGVSCDTFCGCEILQTPGLASDQDSQLYACQNQLTPDENVSGFCEIDQMRTDENGAPAPLGNAALVAECPSEWKRLLRFVGAGQPASEARVFIGCTE